MDWFTGLLDRFGLGTAYVLVAVGLVLIYVTFAVTGFTATKVFGYAVLTAPIWLPLGLFLLFFEYWGHFVRKRYDLEQGRVTLEILLPQEIFKSPQAMELVLEQMYQKASPDNLVETYWDGKHPPTFTLELVSKGGSVHFYINTPRRKFKNLIEAQMYAQYPGIEIRELPVDYAAEFPWDPDNFNYMSLHFGLKQDEVFPIKTYYEFGLQDMPKEEEKVDPMTPMLDCIGSITAKENIWIQILISAHRDVNFEVGSLFSKPDWKGRIKEKINELVKRDENGMAPLELEGMPRITEGEKRVISALERSLSKYPFNTNIRAMYISHKDSSHLYGERIGPLITSWFQYADNMSNQFGMKWRADFDYNWWQDPSGKRRMALKKTELEHYKKRFYTAQAKGNFDASFVLTTEELATIFHLPGKVALTPSLGRIPSTRSEAPPNLPTG